MKKLYHTEVVNDQGMSGSAFVKGDHELAVVTSSPTSSDPGTNPEQLLALSWATCLNATLEILLKKRGIDKKSRVEVHIDYMEDENSNHYFSLNLFASIETMSVEEATPLVEEAQKRCPVSKIVGHYEHVSSTVVLFEEERS